MNYEETLKSKIENAKNDFANETQKLNDFIDKCDEEEFDSDSQEKYNKLERQRARCKHEELAYQDSLNVYMQSEEYKKAKAFDVILKKSMINEVVETYENYLEETKMYHLDNEHILAKEEWELINEVIRKSIGV